MGPGDDAAVLRLGDGGELVVTSDLLNDGVDFHANEVSPRRIGHKALAVNLSDLAAMAARPHSAIVSLALPRSDALELAKELYEGMAPLLARYDVALAGGDTNCWDQPLVISVTLLGTTTARGPLLRQGARPGDLIVVTGALGGSILGRHLDVAPRVDEALALHERYTLHAGIDVSDGLALDLGRLCDESGVGAIVRTAEIPIHPDAVKLSAQAGDSKSPLEHALGDGEDFELILAVPPDEARRMIAQRPLAIPLTVIGEFTAERGLVRIDADGVRRPLERTGFEHRGD